jgi:hypothetical protein
MNDNHAQGPGYKDDNPKTILGLKKPSFHAIPASALIELGKGMANGEFKYGLYNYRDKTVSASIYFDAMQRHLWDWWDGRDFSNDTNPPVHHLGHVMACAAIVLDAASVGKLNDDRGTPGTFDRLIEEYTANVSKSV